MSNELRKAFNHFMDTLSCARSSFHNSEQWYSEGHWNSEETFQEKLDAAEANVRAEIDKLSEDQS